MTASGSTSCIPTRCSTPALWTDDLIAERAAGYGLTPEQYRRRNVLGAEVTSAHVAAAVVALCGPTFARTTGAQIPVDGGNERVI